MAGRILVYGGEGAGKRSVHMAQTMLSALTAHAVEVLPGKDALVERLTDHLAHASPRSAEAGAEAGDDQRRVVLLVFPGGADRPYQKALAGEPNALIRQYVETGGAYLGFCAGAYYACSSIVFDGLGPLCVREDRELLFYSGQGVGPIFMGFAYNTQSGAFAVPVCWRGQKHTGEATGKEHTTPEVETEAEADTAIVYFNGGCTFVADPGSCTTDATVLATYNVLPGYTLDPCVEQLFQGADVAASFPAIVRTRVGKGVAVLSGVHPEFAPSILKELMGVSDKDLVEGGEAPERIIEGKTVGALRSLFADMDANEKSRLNLLQFLLQELECV